MEIAFLKAIRTLSDLDPKTVIEKALELLKS